MANFKYNNTAFQDRYQQKTLKEIFKGYGFDEEAYRKQKLKGGEIHEQNTTKK